MPRVAPFRFLAVATALAAMTLLQPTSALAAPANDAFDAATVIGSLPFSDVVNTTDSTTEPDEPQACNFMSQTIWYSITPETTTVLKADNAGTGFATNLNVYQATGPGFGGLSFLGCSQNPNAVSFTAQAGTTYYVQTGILFGAVGDLHINVQAVPPPPNDDFANATPITSLPFTDTADTTAATVEASEPTPSCGFGAPSGSVWYAFTPAASGSVSANVNAPFSTLVAAYTGTSLTSLTDLGCRSSGSVLTIRVNAGETYYFQTGGVFGQRGSLSFNLAVAPPPQANFSFSPGDPSVFDIVQFFDQSFDPGGVGIESQAWDFGDGATATGCCPTHRYAADGDYTAELTVTTFDGRTASTSRLLRVITHDVAITKFSAPMTASAGQTRQISVGISDKRYPETVQVQLFKSVPGGFQLVGTLTQSVPVRGGNRTTGFDFSYTFTSDDAAIGKVTFKAVATIVDARDALPADNEAIASPTKVSR